MAQAELERPRVFYDKPIDFPPIPAGQIPKNVKDLDFYATHYAIPNGNLRRGQKEALTETVDLFGQGVRSLYVDQVSGYGKSKLMQVIGEGFGGTHVYVVPGHTASTNILEKHEGRDIGLVDGTHKEFGHQTTVITIETLKSMHRAISRGDHRRLDEAASIFQADLIFADEFHHYLTPDRLKLLSTFLYLNPNSFLVGASASPDFNANKNGEKLFGREAHYVSAVEGVEEGVLLSPHVKFVKTGFSLDKAKVRSNGDYVLNSAVPLNVWDTKLLEAYLDTSESVGRQLRTIAYAATVDHANSLAELAIQMGIPAEVITGATKNRDEIYEKLRRGKLGTVVTVQTAIESLDKTWLEGTLHSAQTASWRVAKQMYFRSMRYEEGKDPWIIQAVADNTSASNRPILVTDVLGARRFVNGSVVIPSEVPRGIEKSGLGMSEFFMRPTTTPDQYEMSDLEVNTEIIDVNSLFKMSLLDRARLIHNGLARDQLIEEFTIEVKDMIKKRFGESMFFPTSGNGLSDVRFFDSTGFPFSLGSLIASFQGINMRDIRREHIDKFLLALDPAYETTKFFRVEDRSHYQSRKQVDDEKSEEQKEFLNLCAKFKDGALTEDEKRQLASQLHEIWKTLPEGVGLELNNRKFNHVVFDGSVNYLGNILGLNTKDRGDHASRFLAESRRGLLDFINSYSGEDPIGSVKPKRVDLEKSDDPRVVNAEIILRQILEEAKASGHSFDDGYYFAGVMVKGVGFEMSLPTYFRLLGATDVSSDYISKYTMDKIKKFVGWEDKQETLESSASI